MPQTGRIQLGCHRVRAAVPIQDGNGAASCVGEVGEEWGDTGRFCIPPDEGGDREDGLPGRKPAVVHHSRPRVVGGAGGVMGVEGRGAVLFIIV